MKKKTFSIILIISFIFSIAIIGYFIWEKHESNKYLINLSYNEFKEKIENKESFVLLVVKEGCSACTIYEPIFKQVITDLKIKAFLIDMATYENEELKKLEKIFNISATPTTIFVVDGDEISIDNRIVGSTTSDKLISRLKANGYIKE